ncbi:hypothetical protein GQ42DRAFT_168568, partial [Ramicandelaber brevisporus]
MRFVYLPPTDRNGQTSVEFQEQIIEETLDDLPDGATLIIGDTNGHMGKDYGDKSNDGKPCARGVKLMAAMEENEFDIVMPIGGYVSTNIPTHGRETFIDQVWANTTALARKPVLSVLDPESLDEGLSKAFGHKLLMLELDANEPPPLPETVSYDRAVLGTKEYKAEIAQLLPAAIEKIAELRGEGLPKSLAKAQELVDAANDIVVEMITKAMETAAKKQPQRKLSKPPGELRRQAKRVTETRVAAAAAGRARKAIREDLDD